MTPQDLLKQRTEARAQRNYALADRLRQELQSLGYEVIDTPDGSVLRSLSIARFPALELMQKYFFASYIAEDGQRWGICLFPHTKTPQWETAARKAIRQIEASKPEDAGRLESFVFGEPNQNQICRES